MGQTQRLKVLLAGLCSQILCVGIARFAYTPLLPVMQTQTWIGDAEGGWLAAANYVGYMCGAFLAASIADLRTKDTLYRISLLLALVTTAAMAFTEQLWLWALLRFLAGLSSAGAMLIAAGLILNWLIRHQHRSELGIHFAGVGAGILVAALAVELMLNLSQNWAQQWLWLTLLGVALALPAWCWLPRPDMTPSTQQGKVLTDTPPTGQFMALMLGAYFCAGYGYVISATFIVTIVERLPDMAGRGTWVFALMGLAAIPAVMLWDLIARFSGYLYALMLAMAIQIIGILLPVFSQTLSALMLSAVLFGGTFIGCVSLVLTMAGRLYPTRPAKLMGKMTLAYGIALVVAPALTGLLAERSGNYNAGLLLAGAFVGVGLLLVFWLRLVDETARELESRS